MFFETITKRIVLLGVILLLSMSERTLSFTQQPIFHSPSSRVAFSAPHSSLRMSSGPAVLDRPETIEKVDIDEDKKTDMDEKFSSGGWEIRLFNDPFNKREFVARCLATICGKSDGESYQIMVSSFSFRRQLITTG